MRNIQPHSVRYFSLLYKNHILPVLWLRLMETPKEKTARITREIEEERKLRHQQMDQSFKTQKQIRNSEQKEAKKEKELKARAVRNQKIRKLLGFVCSRNLLIFLFVIVALVLGILFWRTILDVLYQF